ncbi:hypothetical protein GLOTRDRAFT_138303 [Gloeophyllum trabeum ATCC 11539]|uniref:Protein Zds1 C-terminal domain-containing protein n=1 Tax=Gloeophyllum trabeum (strain ATCC 11539 / FP-39264 / Madison 617) TaxID=670483 RepID=S7RTY9_GLOTA|nr:uncharacterized protein GLOTRDRAFT_138303 [Gloeophyllum trabeum ATCC 11539]EPQ56624.1 hypothetical protein GLOTRDRAFT_138303 [Gloeophyllum trabeum ATCC 11539]
MQPSEDEIQREVEALRDIKRRSTAQGGPGALLLDPDLPSQSSPPSPHSWSGSSSTAVDDSSSSSHESASGRESPAEDPFHLFWVPASLHPEIAPDQFRAFLKEHARAPPDGNVTLSRSSSASSTGLGRKQSMLRKQYKPRPNDGVEEEEVVVPLRRDRSSYYANAGPQLTISDLQKLEELADEASKSDDPSKLRSVLRRSLSMNIAPSVIDQMDDMPSMGDEADAPIIVPPPGQILRRTARTKIRKPGQTTEGSHRFQTTRSRRKSGPGGRAPTAPPGDTRTSSDLSSNDHSDGDHLKRPRRMTSETIDAPSRPESYSEESSIFDAYVTEEPEEETPHAAVTSPPARSAPLAPEPVILVEPKAPESEPAPSELQGPVLHHPQPKRLLQPPASPEVPATSRTPSPEPMSPSIETNLSHPGQVQQPAFLSTPSPPPRTPSPSHRKDKDKDDKGLFKWGGDKGSKKGAKEKDREYREQKEKEKKGFFGSLFGNKKKQEEQPQSNLGHASGREAAIALLGASKSSKSPAPSPSPQPGGPYARYPIHVERAIYRLSHIKLANPRRPLYEQVLISNLMFWYLGVINKTQNQGTAQPQAAANGQSPQGPSPAEKEKLEQEQREREERERAERERAEREKEMERNESKTQPRRGSLTKGGASGTPGRRAEMPVRGPQYELQHRAMEQEYGGSPGYGPGSAPMGRASSAPPINGSGGYSGGYSARSQGPSQGAPLYSQPHSGPPQVQLPNDFYYDASSGPEQRSVGPRPVSPQLPPGAMPPVTSVSVDQSWFASSPAPAPVSRGPASPSSTRATSPPNSNTSAAAAPPPLSARQSRSPPPHNRYTPVLENHVIDGTGGMKPTRSMSANAAPPPMPPMNGKIRKVSSAHAVPSNHRPRTSDGISGSEEDVPLAYYQQQRRR